ncbi:hypothetical protein DL93DRAFT_2091475 [Clavulina sp. PMI_390]|nr:hypothetical protein DL93DRAFT_2091475 [Clavulina sp. PMI_390]
MESVPDANRWPFSFTVPLNVLARCGILPGRRLSQLPPDEAAVLLDQIYAHLENSTSDPHDTHTPFGSCKTAVL